MYIFRNHLVQIPEANFDELESKIFEEIFTCKTLEVIPETIWNIIECKLISVKNLSDDTKKLIDNVEAYIKNNFTSDIKVEDISKVFNFNSSYMTKMFKRYKGETPIKMLINLRIREAMRLMKSCPDMGLKDIGELVGYSDHSYFSRAFKNATGKSPTEYREGLRQE